MTTSRRAARLSILLRSPQVKRPCKPVTLQNSFHCTANVGWSTLRLSHTRLLNTEGPAPSHASVDGLETADNPSVLAAEDSPSSNRQVGCGRPRYRSG